MYEQIRRNRRASWLLMGFVIALLAALLWLRAPETLPGRASPAKLNL